LELLNVKVSELHSREVVDSRCRDMTASWRRERAQSDPNIELCDFYEVTLSNNKNKQTNK
jgi:hypothetical protein